MTRICIVDIDGVVADSTERFKRAAEAGDRASSAYWKVAFTPELVSLDTRIFLAEDHLNTLCFEENYEIIFLTSRPETMRKATLEWLFRENILYYFRNQEALVMKAPAFQYTKTTVWKAGMVQTLAALYGASSVLFVDDEIANSQAVFAVWDHAIPLRVCGSLQDAIEGLTK